MKLYLSSYRLGDQAERLAQLVSKQKRVGVIRNALNYSDHEVRLEAGRAREFAELEALGLYPKDLDLKVYFGAHKNLRDTLSQLDALWVVGGNTFILRRAMRQSGLDVLLHEMPETFVYAGYSAGACPATPTL